MNPFIIGIAGESGVGKTTIANIIELYYGNSSVTKLSTDDLHKWTRNDDNWKKFTHLNPLANNLELGDLHIKELKSSNKISRAIYNHKTGKFDEPIIIEPKPYIINEGLHSFYSDYSKQNTDLKIYIDVCDSLRTHWKIIRDVRYRGYTVEKVLEAINYRKEDATVLRENQITCSDVIINIKTKNAIKNIGNEKEKIDIDISFKYLNKLPIYLNSLFDFIKNYYIHSNEYIKICQLIGQEENLIQYKGGNFSIKIKPNLILIKSSGFNMADTNFDSGYTTAIVPSNKSNLFKNELDYNNKINELTLSGSKPSMEIGFHIAIDKKYVLHTHPKYLNAILSTHKEVALDILSKIYAFEYKFIEYCTPGIDLFQEINKNVQHKVYFLQNHGLIVASDIANEVIELSTTIDEKAKEFLNSIKAVDNFPETNKFYFPDAFILKDIEIIKHNNKFISYYASHLGRDRSLNDRDIEKLSESIAEKWRQSV
jgi:uridine kinase/ribulose-5-phosphate 4-epimerase/fuculose-1-phosphate aldolase